jgi:translation initiation factor IF-2
MNRRNILTISSVAACAVIGGTAAWILYSPRTTPERIQVTTVGQGPTKPPVRPAGPGAGPKPGGFGTTPAPGGPARPGAPGVGKPGGVFGNAKGAPAPAAPAKPTHAAIPNRKGHDPFYVTWHVIPPPPYVFEELEPIRLAPPEEAPIEVKPYEVREEAVARVSGIMSGDGIYAILEMPQGDPVIVKPGSSVELPIAGGQTKRTYKVVSIKGETVVLRSTEGLATFTQEIPLSDVPLGGQSASQASGFPGGAGRFGPGAPGSFGGGGRRGRGPGGASGAPTGTGAGAGPSPGN